MTTIQHACATPQAVEALARDGRACDLGQLARILGGPLGMGALGQGVENVAQLVPYPDGVVAGGRRGGGPSFVHHVIEGARQRVELLLLAGRVFGGGRVVDDHAPSVGDRRPEHGIARGRGGGVFQPSPHSAEFAASQLQQAIEGLHRTPL